jgi:hypothetical protein
MPAYLKLILSVLVTIVALVVHWTQGEAGRDFNSWLVLGLGIFMILAVWLFPEPRRQTRKDGP